MDDNSFPTITEYPDSELFSLGVVTVTAGVRNTLTTVEVMRAVLRHASGDWGDLCDEDREENEFALKHGYRLFSVYEREESDSRIYVITEADRSVTTVLLPEEY